MKRYLIIIGVVLGGFSAALAVAYKMLNADFAPAATSETEITLPTGHTVTFHEVIQSEPGTSGLAVRFRFIEPDLAEVKEQTDYSVLEADMQFLCETYALERIANIGPQPAQVIISIADREVAFGEADPTATQIFEAYRPVDGACIWEGL